VVKFDEKTLAAERRVYPFVLLIGIILLVGGTIIVSNVSAFLTGFLVLAVGTALFSAGIFWWVDRKFHLED
jgi:1,4-dihydroxy-2-naphthoate octaprenyltransferase